ncbi:MAG: peptidylprolyl isomerase [Planctomycetes bacterium]|nr:peptidylprolyl isomerase [Planctomycetota bacterium]
MIKKDSRVKIHYKLTVDGEVVDSSEGNEPLDYIHGANQIIPGLEEALEGLKAGDKKEVSVVPEKGYGPHNPDALQRVPKTAFHGADELIVGEMVLGNAGGREFEAKIVEVTDKEVRLDLNHTLAGKTLEFSVEVVEVA